MIRVSASTVLRNASSARAAAVVLSPESLPKWFTGAKNVVTDGAWPALRATMNWQVGGSRFEATVVENALPGLLRMEVRTPSADSTITHRFEDQPDGRTRYEKMVEARPRGRLTELFSFLLKPLLGSFVRKEVERAAALADRAATADPAALRAPE